MSGRGHRSRGNRRPRTRPTTVKPWRAAKPAAVARGEAGSVRVVLEREHLQGRAAEGARVVRDLPVQQSPGALMARWAEDEQHRQRSAAGLHADGHPTGSDTDLLSIEYSDPISTRRRLRTHVLDRVRFENQPLEHVGHDPPGAYRIESSVNQFDRHSRTPSNSFASVTEGRRPSQPARRARTLCGCVMPSTWATVSRWVSITKISSRAPSTVVRRLPSMLNQWRDEVAGCAPTIRPLGQMKLTARNKAKVEA